MRGCNQQAAQRVEPSNFRVRPETSVRMVMPRSAQFSTGRLSAVKLHSQNKRRNEYCHTSTAQDRNQAVLVLSAAHKNRQTGSWNHKEKHPKMKILMHKE